MRYGFNIQLSCSDNSLLPLKGEGLAYACVTMQPAVSAAPSGRKNRKRVSFLPCDHPGAREEGGGYKAGGRGCL